MNSNWWVAPVAFVSIAVIAMLVWTGVKIETNRIYYNCLSNNGSMVYNEAVKLCKDIVK
jgi:hypothetical protein